MLRDEKEEEQEDNRKKGANQDVPVDKLHNRNYFVVFLDWGPFSSEYSSNLTRKSTILTKSETLNWSRMVRR